MIYMNKLLFIWDVGEAVGLGHAVRSRALLEYMRARCNCTHLEADGIDAHTELLLKETVCAYGGDYAGVVFDLERGAPTPAMLQAAGAAKKIAFVGAGYKNIGYENLDLSFVQGIPVPPPTGSNCFHGTDWVVLRERFTDAYHSDRHDGDRRDVFICGGGSDPQDLTWLAITALLQYAPLETRIHVLLGRYYRGPARSFHLGAVYNYPEGYLLPVMRMCDMAIVSYGMTALECLAVGLPTIALSMSDDHNNSAAALAEQGALVNAGLIAAATQQSVAARYNDLCSNPALCAKLSATGRRLIDGRGVERVAAKIMEVIA